MSVSAQTVSAALNFTRCAVFSLQDISKTTFAVSPLLITALAVPLYKTPSFFKVKVKFQFPTGTFTLAAFLRSALSAQEPNFFSVPDASVPLRTMSVRTASPVSKAIRPYSVSVCVSLDSAVSKNEQLAAEKSNTAEAIIDKSFFIIYLQILF